MKQKITALTFAVIFTTALLYSCSDSSVTNQTDNFNISLMGSQDSAGDSQNILILDTVKILIEDIKLNVSNSNHDSTNFKVGPYILFLDLRSGINQISSAAIPDGQYDKVKFEIHKLNDNETISDPEFADVNGRYSVIVKGRYLGNYFVYRSSKSAHQILNFPVNISVNSETSTNVTLVVKPYIWFISNDVYLDPGNPANSNDIDNNIKNNFKNCLKAFKDDDRNGIPD